MNTVKMRIQNRSNLIIQFEIKKLTKFCFIRFSYNKTSLPRKLKNLSTLRKLFCKTDDTYFLILKHILERMWPTQDM